MFCILPAVVLTLSLTSVSSLPSNQTGLRLVPPPAGWTSALATSRVQDPEYDPAPADTTSYIESPDWTLYRDSNASLNQHQPDRNVTYNTAASGNPYPDDVLQGHLGDCYLAASLRALAARAPESIKQALRPVNATTLSLRVNLQIDNATYTTIDVGLDDTYQQDSGVMSLKVFKAASGMDIIWPAEIEKAMAKLMAFCIAESLPCAQGHPHANDSYADLISGIVAISMFVLTGRQFSYFLVSQLSDADILNLFEIANTQPCVLATASNNTGFMYPDHAQWMVGTSGCSLVTSNPLEQANRVVTLGDIRAQVVGIYVPADQDYSGPIVNASCLSNPLVTQISQQKQTA